MRNLALVLLASCTAPPPARSLTSVPMPPGVVHTITLDAATCHAPDGAPWPIYDGAAWQLGTTAAPIRCGVQLSVLEAAYLYAWEVAGEHLSAGPQLVTACAQLTELGGAGHYNQGPCETSAATEAGPYMIVARQSPREDGSWLGLLGETALSVIVHGNGHAGSTVAALRLLVTEQ